MHVYMHVFAWRACTHADTPDDGIVPELQADGLLCLFQRAHTVDQVEGCGAEAGRDRGARCQPFLLAEWPERDLQIGQLVDRLTDWPESGAARM